MKNIQEEVLEIQTQKGHTITWTLNYEETKSEKLIIFVHGLAGNQNDHLFFNAAAFFPENWYTTYRFNLYSTERPLSNLTLNDHYDDLNDILHYFKETYKNIYLVWHSLWGPVILGSNIQNIAAIALWDPTLNLISYAENYCSYNKKIDRYILQRDTEILLSKEMIQERKKLDTRILKNIIKPTKIICAGKFLLKKHWIDNQKEIKAQYEIYTIEEAGHCFHEIWTENKLYTETLNRFKLF